MTARSHRRRRRARGRTGRRDPRASRRSPAGRLELRAQRRPPDGRRPRWATRCSPAPTGRRPSRSTTTRSGYGFPTDPSSRSLPATPPPWSRCDPDRTRDVRVDVHVDPTRLRACARDRRAGRPHRDAQGAPAEVLLRRSRLGALRRRSLGCPSTTRHAPSAAILEAVAPRDRRAHRRRHARSSSDRARRRRRGCCSARCDARRHARALRAVRRERGHAARARPRGGRRVRRSRCTRSSATSSATSTDFPTGGTRMVAFLGSTIGNLTPGGARRVPCRDRGRPRSPATRSCSAPTS